MSARCEAQRVSRSTLGMELDDQYTLGVASHLQTAVGGEIIRLLRRHCGLLFLLSYTKRQMGLSYALFSGRSGGKACRIAAASVCNSKSASCRSPLMKNLGVPLTPLLTASEKSR